MLVVDPTLPENAIALLQFHYSLHRDCLLFLSFSFNHYSFALKHRSLNALLPGIKDDFQVSFGKR